MNSFCKHCAGYNIREIVNCEFKYCPFYPFRLDDLDWQVKQRCKERIQTVIRLKKFRGKVKVR